MMGAPVMSAPPTPFTFTRAETPAGSPAPYMHSPSMPASLILWPNLPDDSPTAASASNSASAAVSAASPAPHTRPQPQTQPQPQSQPTVYDPEIETASITESVVYSAQGLSANGPPTGVTISTGNRAGSSGGGGGGGNVNGSGSRNNNNSSGTSGPSSSAYATAIRNLTMRRAQGAGVPMGLPPSVFAGSQTYEEGGGARGAQQVRAQVQGQGQGSAGAGAGTGAGAGAGQEQGMGRAGSRESVLCGLWRDVAVS